MPSIVVLVTDGAVRNRYIEICGHEAFFPPDAFGGSPKDEMGHTLTLHFAGTNETVETDIARRRFFRARGATEHFLTNTSSGSTASWAATGLGWRASETASTGSSLLAPDRRKHGIDGNCELVTGCAGLTK